MTLEAAITTCVDHWNDDPKSFAWHKSGDEILETLAAYCQRITDSGHEPGSSRGSWKLPCPLSIGSKVPNDGRPRQGRHQETGGRPKST